MTTTTDVISTRVPARMDRLPWTRWHWLIVLSLGTVWVLDGLEVTIKGAVGASLKDSIGFSTVQVAGSASIYILGAITGALFWGYLTDRFGRKKLFLITLLVYFAGILVTVTAGLWVPDGSATYAWFATGRLLIGLGIGGEYSAINSAIDELIPARVRGTVALVVNGSYWLGAALAAALGYLYLTELPSDLGWRVAFGTGGVIAVGILLLRLYVPESPRWLLVHGRGDEAERVVSGIERKVERHTGEPLPEVGDDQEIQIRERKSTGFVEIGRTVFKVYPRRAAVGFALMGSQAFLYNAIFFTYGLMLTTFYGVRSGDVPLYMLPFAVGNFLGPVLLGPLFDRVGRRPLIGTTFALAGLLTVLTGWAFQAEALTTVTQTVAWVVIFFFASAGASAGYLTVSETFPLEIRAMVIAFFYAIATAISGILGPYVFGNLIATENRANLMYGYLFAGGVMLVAAVVHVTMGVRAEQRSLEDIAEPLSVAEAEEQKQEGPAQDRPEAAARAETPSATPARVHPAQRRQLWSPRPVTVDMPAEDTYLDHEVELLVRALAEDGPATTRELTRRVRSRYWGPGRFRRALRTAVADHRVVRAGGGEWQAAVTERERLGVGGR